jgi:tetratricopeptide (TPR) repeat protein
MTKMSGLQTAQILAPKKLSPILLVVEELSDQITDMGSKLGLAGYLQMPLSLESVKKAVTEAAEAIAAREMQKMAAEESMLKMAGDADPEAIVELNARIAAKLETTLNMAPWSLNLRNTMVGVYMIVARHKDAVPILKKLIKEDFGDRQAHKQLAECYKKLGKSLEDLPSLLKNVEENPQSPEAHYKIASHYMREGETDKAVDHFKKAVECNKDGAGEVAQSELLTGLGTAIMAEGERTGDNSKLSEAFKELKNAITADPEASAGYFHMSDCLKKLNKEKEANAVLEVALRKEPRSASEFLEWFFFYLLRAEKEKAKTALDKAMEIDPENQITMCLAGEAYFRNGMYEEAIALFERAVEINPSDIRLYNWLGICYRRLSKTSKAVERYQNALIIDPEDFNVHFNLGRAYMTDKDFKNAKTEFATALKYKPDLKEAKEAMESLPKVL